MMAVPRQTPGPGAFALSLGLHAAVLWLAPQLQHAPPPVPLRVTVQLAQVADAQQAEPAPPQSEPPPPKPQPKPQPKPRAQPSQQPEPHPETLLPLMAVADPVDAVDAYAVPELPQSMAAAEVVPAAPVSEPVTSPADTADAPAVSDSSDERHADTDAVDADTAWQSYGRMLYDMVSRNKRYPPIAVRRHWQGRASVSVKFVHGRLAALALVNPGSGHQVLDDAALEMLKKAVEALPLSSDLATKSFTVIVPVDFRLEG